MNSIKIYKAISPSGKIYIGQTINFELRKIQHNRHSINEKYKEYNYAFHKAVRKYGFDNVKWEILNEDLSQEKADMWERLWIFIEKSNDPNFGYNMTEGGDGVGKANMGKIHTKEHNQKISDALKGNKNPFYGKKHTLEARKKISDNHADFSGSKHPSFGKKTNNKRDEKGRFIKS